MFIKIGNGIVINTDRVAFIDIGGENMAQVYEHFDMAHFIQIPVNAAHYLLAALEANMAVDLEMDPARYTRTLTSQIAVALRDNFPDGATGAQLSEITGADATAVYEALDSLASERVAVMASDSDELWYHASNVPRAVMPEGALALADFNSRETLYHWDCKKHTPAHLNSVTVSGKDFQAGILYCDQCGESHVVDDKVLALYGAPVIAADVPEGNRG